MFKTNYFGLHQKYSVILTDPPWSFITYGEENGTGKDRSAEQHYDTMTLQDICNLPVKSLASDRCALFMWVTDTHLPHSFEVLKAWGFEFRTIIFHWSKVNRKKDSLFMGLGYFARANSEICLLASPIGQKCPERLNKGVPKTILEGEELESVAIVSRIRQHSRKPDEQYTRIEQLFAGPYVELFATSVREGWSGWGNQYGKYKDGGKENG